MLRARSRVVWAVLLTVLCVAVAAQSAEPAGDNILKSVPADVLFCVRVRNLEYTASMLDQYLVGIAPFPYAASTSVRTPLAKILGNPQLNGINMTGSFSLFATVGPNQGAPDIFVLIPVTDYGKVTDANSNVGSPDGNNISIVKGEKQQFGCITKVGDYALLSKDYDKTLAISETISAADAPKLLSLLDSDEVKQAGSAPVWAYGNIPKASKTYGQMLLTEMDKAKKELEKVSSDPNMPKQLINPAFVIDFYGRWLKTLLDEGKSITITGSPKPDLILLKAAFKALPETKTAGMLTADTSARGQNKLVGYLEDGAAMNFVGRMNPMQMKKINSEFIDLMAQLAGTEPNSPDVEKIRTLSVDFADSFNGPFVGSCVIDPNAKPMFQYKYVASMTDTDKFNNAMAECTRIWDSSIIAGFLKKMGMETTFSLKPETDNYEGLSIRNANFSMKWGDANSPQGKMLNALYGGGLDYRWTFVKDLWICAISSDLNTVRRLIDRVKAGPPPQICSEIQKAMALIPDSENADMLFTYNYLRFFDMMRAMAPVPMPKLNIPSKSNLVFAARLAKDSAAVDIALPKEHVLEVMTLIQMMMQQQMQQQMQKQMQQQMESMPSMQQPVPLPPGANSP